MITFTLSDVERSKSMSLKLGKLISRTGAELGHMLLVNSNSDITVIGN